MLLLLLLLVVQGRGCTGVFVGGVYRGVCGRVL